MHTRRKHQLQAKARRTMLPQAGKSCVPPICNDVLPVLQAGCGCCNEGLVSAESSGPPVLRCNIAGVAALPVLLCRIAGVAVFLCSAAEATMQRRRGGRCFYAAPTGPSRLRCSVARAALEHRRVVEAAMRMERTPPGLQ